MIKEVKISLISFAIGAFCMLLIGLLVKSCSKPVTVSKQIRDDSTLTITTTPGIPDTLTEIKKQGFDFSLKPEAVNATGNILPGDIQSSGKSIYQKHLKLDQAEADLEITTYPQTDSVKVKGELSTKHRTITRVDTVHKTLKINHYEKETIPVTEVSNLFLDIGVQHSFRSGFEPEKFIAAEMMNKLWFFYTNVQSGIYNNLTDGLNNIKIFAKAEIKIPLN